MINLQIDSRHKEFLGVLCLHDYYHDNICRDFEFEPTPETAMVLRNYKLIFKPASFGFLILYTPGSSEERLRQMPLKTRLSFIIHNRNNRFMNFSKIKFWPEGAVFHYSNISGSEREIKYDVPTDVYFYFKGLKVGDLKKKLLHLPEHDYVPRKQPRFNLALGADGKDEKGISYDSLVIKDEAGGTELEPGRPYKRRYRDAQRDMFRRFLDHRSRGKLVDLTPSEKEKRLIEISDQLEKELSGTPSIDHVIDLRHALQGKYTVDHGAGPNPVYITEYPDARAFGVLDIHLDTPTDALLNRNADNTEEIVNPQLFHIHFESRATYWRYIFVNYDHSTVTPKEVRDENQVIEFHPPVSGILEQVGTAVKYCESQTPIPLKERPQQVLFVERMNGKRPMKEIRIPTPSSEAMVKPERRPGETEERIYSEIYVYL